MKTPEEIDHAIALLFVLTGINSVLIVHLFTRRKR